MRLSRLGSLASLVAALVFAAPVGAQVRLGFGFHGGHRFGAFASSWNNQLGAFRGPWRSGAYRGLGAWSRPGVGYGGPSVVMVYPGAAGSYWDGAGGYHAAPPYAGGSLNAGPGYASTEVVAVHGRDGPPLWPPGVRPRGRNGNLY